ncbi:hypothetical protein EIP91_004768 [Steccherinum ochraceum]|uniref:Uncharacterized protein n=1 Tax=Steccherinum ochraceum TaxID=92696 RepID=A0A4R0R871_9APHY|nr:hypothetical protein EIP91_004768 [Steccherinum ochraceum]
MTPSRLRKPRDLPVLDVDLAGRTVLVVGCNTGLGLETMKHFARMRPKRLVGTCRDEEKCAQTEKVIKEETGFEDVLCWPLELTSFASVKCFTARFEHYGDGCLDIMILNAAMATLEYGLTADGFESTVQVNHLSGALLSLLLLRTLLQTAYRHKTTSRLVIVSSGVHQDVHFGPNNMPEGKGVLETLSSEAGSSVMQQRYHETKLLNILFTRALQAHLPLNSPLLVTAVDPGFSLSSRVRQDMEKQPDEFREVLEFARTAEEGSRQIVYGALGPKDQKKWEKLRGAYVSDNEVKEPSQWVRSREGRVVQKMVWNETLSILSGVDARIAELIR